MCGSGTLSWQAATKLLSSTQPVQTSMQQTNIDIRLKQQHATVQLFRHRWRGHSQDFGRWILAPESQRDDKECCCLEGENAKS